MFPKLLIANRGEIAVRVIRACKEMGISTVAVFSEADRDALHVSLADESVCIGPASAAGSYLNMPAVLSAAVLTGAQAIHPGYGLLSENARFAEMCAQCHIKFIGPSAEVIRRMGDKDEARRTMRAAGVPVVPGCDLVENVEQLRAEAEKIGYPLLIKARSGGGGRGIRRVDGPEELEHAFLSATAEAQSAFGDGAVYMEKLLENVKHVEVQLLCDAHGNAVTLGERECSMQRKHQKLIEESPSPAVDETLRAKMLDAAARAAKAVGYEGVGTVEFLLTKDKQFYFMEMNTRLQVEHPVTEMVTGIDLVKWQIRVAAGMEIPFKQEDVRLSGHAIECRINAENPAENFRPCAGKVTLLHVPGGPWVRFDTALYQDYSIPPFYDSMIAKLIVHAPMRAEAIRKMQAALCEMVIEGVEHTGWMQADLIAERGFEDGSYTTDYLSGR
ncbi:MAG TPA: acetyl-CoA carboxylase biotin carboxylase subunit [Candidatus Pullichristensenella stercorigallinarum]|uniref:Biotin carboxylase n=1 Tax=Candidatus Pullichristensenella stercorigallinarum TaxID=2840909 RepID=A0A9D1CWL5_9FIRM|nr:acetyl-CoA carboxylase biotin carboxylase subunit [Candidatus Pullichristensenella stercorigallinarum]